MMSGGKRVAGLLLSGLFLSLCIFNHPLHAADDLFEMLLEKARYLQARGKPDQSAEAWRKVLALAPDHKEALLWLGISEAHSGNIEKAQEYATTLSAAGAPAATLGALQRAIAIGSPDAGPLAKARKLAESHHPEEAVPEYKRAFRGIEPTDFLALEFYQVVAATADGWATAKSGFGELVKEFPGQPLFRYTLARHLSYREETRRAAINKLLRLLKDDAVGAAAAKDLHQALAWLQVRPGDMALLDRLAEEWPDNKTVRAKRKELEWLTRGPNKRDLALKRAYEQIERGQLAEAERRLQPFISASSDGEIPAAIGLIRLKQGRFEEAAQSLGEALSRDPHNTKAESWRSTLQNARFWSLLHRADALKQESRFDEAERVLRQALEQLPAEAVAKNALADLLAKQGRPQEARQQYEEVLQRDPANVDARFGLVFVLVELGERARALQIANELTREHPEKGVAFAQIRAQEFADQALLANNEESRNQAMSKLQGMLALDPANLWIRLDLARVYRAMGKRAEAHSLLDGLLLSNPGHPAVLYARALLHAEEGEDAAAMALLEKIPADARNADMRKLQNRLWLNLQIQRAAALADAGQVAQAHALMEQVADEFGSDEASLGPIANGWRNIGDRGRALALLRQSRLDGVDLKLLYLSLLLETNQGAEAELVMADLEKHDLNPRQRQALDDLYIGYSVRRANEMRQRGDYAKAYDYLAPLRQNYPDNSAAVVALATLHATVGDDNEAFNYYADVLKKNPQDSSALSGAVGVALKEGDYPLAQQMVAGALQESPSSAEVQALAGHVARLMGDDAAAVRHLEMALALNNGTGAASGPLQRVSLVDEPKLQLRRLGGDAPLMLSRSDNIADDSVTPAQPLSGPMLAAAEELAALRAAYGSRAAAGLVMRHRSGDPGLNKLNDIEMPLEYSFGAAYHGRLSLGVVPVVLDSGDLQPGKAKNFGSYMLNRAAIPPSLPQNDNGVALTLAYDSRYWHVDAGTSPIGFKESSMVGGVRYRFSVDELKSSIGFNRRAVTQSLLSYAGAKDPLTGRRWGGVTESGLDLSGSYDLGGSGIYGVLTFASLNGTHVPDNSKVQFSAGFYNDLIDNDRERMVTGLHVNALGFDRNLSGYSLGHGGYFSPNRYLSLSLPLNWSSHSDKARYGLGGTIGVQSYANDSADFYPEDGDLQRQLTALAASDSKVTATYSGADHSNLTYGLHGEYEYDLDRQIAVGSRVDVAKSQNFNEFAVMVYAVFWGVPQKAHMAPDPVRPFYRGMNYD